jgi:hypothetical protein
MPRFYLHLCNGSGFVEDEEGIDYADEATPRNAAVQSLRDVLAGELLRGDLDTGSFIEIEDEDHEWVTTVSFDEVVRMTNETPARSPR